LFSPATRPREPWLAIDDLFSANKASKAMYLDHDFRQLAQGSSSITEYCRSQKNLSDALADNESHITARTLVINTCVGSPLGSPLVPPSSP
jgi:hypothetical protein